MTPSPDDLRSHYEKLNDEALLEAAAERDLLTPEAQHVLEQAIRQRNLTLPDVNGQNTEEMADPEVWVTVERYRDLSDAIVARAALEAAGIPCFLRDENTVRLDWQISNFLGGMRLQVYQQDKEAAQFILQERVAEAAQAEDVAALAPEEFCPFCGSPDVHRMERGIGLRAAVLWMFALPLPRGSRYWQCSQCGKQFAEDQFADLPS